MRIALIGLDCGTPELLFERYADDMPTLTGLRERGMWGRMQSTAPPITVAILGSGTPAECIFAELLEGRGYRTEVLELQPMGLTQELPKGVDAVLLFPGGNGDTREAIEPPR